MIFGNPMLAAGMPIAENGHRYWRIYITAGHGSRVALTEVEFRAEPGGSDLTGSGTASASSQYSSYSADLAFDNVTSLASRWSTESSNLPAWLMYDFGTPVSVGALYVNHHLSYTMQDFAVQYSDDGSSWTTAWEVTGIDPIDTIEFDISAPIVTPAHITYTNPGTYNFVVPAGVSKLNMAGVAGGGSGSYNGGGGSGAVGYANGVPVTPGETLTVILDAGTPTIKRGSTVLFELARGEHAQGFGAGYGGSVDDCTLPASYTSAALMPGGAGSSSGDTMGGSPTWPSSHYQYTHTNGTGGEGYRFHASGYVYEVSSLSENGADFGGGAIVGGTPGGCTLCIAWGTARGDFVSVSGYAEKIYF